MPSDNGHDPRARLVREKYFSLRPKPLERWLWAQGVPASAERVFWLHWQEGLQRGDWCSQVPLKRVARECCLDLSTVTRAYQLLARIGCIRRTDPGRDPANPFNQASSDDRGDGSAWRASAASICPRSPGPISCSHGSAVSGARTRVGIRPIRSTR